jgi:DNA-binding protein HU-beta
MGKSLTKAQITSTLAEKTGLSKQQVAQFFDALASMAYDEAANGFTVPGIGKLVVVDRKARTGRNPRTGETIQIPAKRALKFRLSKEAKAAVEERTTQPA